MLELAIRLAREAGAIVMSHYRKDVATKFKADASPVTEADLAASRFICEGLAATGLPVISEEVQVCEYAVRSQWDRYWLIDPLDGTREFLNATDEFTVNIALIEKQRPVLGVVYAPALDLMAWAQEGQGAFLQTAQGPVRLQAKSAARVGVCSRSAEPRVERFFSDNGIERNEPVGSSLKFIRIAQGAAGLYARFTGSKEWDTAAGQIILTESGGWIRGADSRQPLAYNKQDLANSNFVVGCADWDPDSIVWPETD